MHLRALLFFVSGLVYHALTFPVINTYLPLQPLPIGPFLSRVCRPIKQTFFLMSFVLTRLAFALSPLVCALYAATLPSAVTNLANRCSSHMST